MLTDHADLADIEQRLEMPEKSIYNLFRRRYLDVGRIVPVAREAGVAPANLLIAFAADRGMPTESDWTAEQREAAELLRGLSPARQAQAVQLLRVHLGLD